MSVTFSVPEPLIVPPFIVIDDQLDVPPAPNANVPDCSVRVPAPLELVPLLNVCVPPLSNTVAPLAMLNAPVSVPPPFRLSVFAFAFTVPVLLKATPTTLVAEPDITHVPALFTCRVPAPPPSWIWLLFPAIVNVPLFCSVAAFCSCR